MEIVQKKELSFGEIQEAFKALKKEERIDQNVPFLTSDISTKLHKQLDVISYFVSLLKLKNYQGEQNKAQYLENIQVAVERLNQLIDDVLNTDWIGSERKILLSEAFSTKHTLEDYLHQIYTLNHQEDSTPSTEYIFSPIDRPWVNSLSSPVNQVFEFIQANYDQPINVSIVAKTVGYSSTYLSNLVKSQTGRTIRDWILKIRMEKARSLLLETDLPINCIAKMVGYPDAGHFIRQFRQLYEAPPKLWRNQSRSQLAE
jgi:AraC-like DNA-binding protein